ncbi:MAG: molybdopterin-binding protein [Rhodospirillales bacterium]|nr:molybdopterin-binding protein [Rhodospirillales bacterium]
MAEAKIVTSCIVVIGNEVLSGRTQDVNIKFLTTSLGEIGIRVTECRVIPDVKETIIGTVNECRAKFDYVFTTGGIGPTHDDITTECIAAAFGKKVVLNPEAEALMLAQYGRKNLTDARLKMAHVPEGAALIDNPISKAPGYNLENVFVLAGVPLIVETMFISMTPMLVGGDKVHSITVTVELPEGKLAAGLEALQNNHQGIDVGSYPYYREGRFGVSIVMRGTDLGELETTADELKILMRSLGGEPL